jgi:fatty-acyl-CoA synthase
VSDEQCISAGLSWVAGASAPPVPSGTIGDWLDQTSERFGDRPALISPWQDLRWSWAELRDRVDSLARGFDSLGLKAGDRVGICAPNCVEWVLTQLATARLGIILVSINPAYRTHELGHALRLSGVRALVTAGRFKSSDYLGMLAELAPAVDGEDQCIFDLGLPDLRYVVEIGGNGDGAKIAFDSLLLTGGRVTPSIPLDENQPINIQFTSGTTGAPKGATLSHRNLLHNAACAAAGMSLSPEDTLCIPVPLYHCFGMVLGVLVCLTSGTAMVFPGQAFDAETVLRTVEKERCTALHGVPTMFLSILDHPSFESFDLSTLRTGIAAGAPCPPAMMRRMIEQMNLRDITIGYGMTETSPLSTQTRPNADLETRTDTVGQMLPHFEGRVIDTNGELVPLGQSGEYCSRGPGVMLGYWNQPEATADAIRGGWMHSGDLATIDEKGRVRIVGRIKDMIIRGGENIYPAELEAFLITHPKIADVSVFGIPDERMGERVVAWIRAHDTIEAADIIEWCRGKIAHHKVPAIVRIVETFPMTVTGKIQKFEMRKIEAETDEIF